MLGIGQNYTLLLFHLYYTGVKECGVHSSFPCIYTGSSKQCHWIFPAQKKSQQELGVQKVCHEVTHLIIVHVYNWVSATLQYNQKEMRGYLVYCLENELFQQRMNL